MRIRLALALAVAAVAAGALLLGGLFRDSRGAVPAPPPEAAAGALENELGTGDTASLVRSLQATLRRDPRDVHSYDLLGLAYQQRARETGHPAYYTKSAGVLRGDFPGAVAAMRLAVDAAVDEPEPLAWTDVQLGKLYWSHGHLGPATRQFRAALETYPGYVYGLDALAQVEAAHGRYARAIRLERRAVETIPLPQFVTTLGDLEHVTGHDRLARRQYALIGVIRRLLAANGIRTDLETALFDVDHGVRLPHTLAPARLPPRDRPST